MPETNTSQRESTSPHHFKPVSRSAFDLFWQCLPKLLVFVNEKFQIDNKYQCVDADHICLELVEDFNRKFGHLLAAVYDFSLFEFFADEFFWLVAEHESRGLQRSFLELDLKAWMLGINSLIRRPESTELVQPLECLHRYMPIVHAQFEAREPEIEPNAARFVDMLLKKNRKFASEFLLGLMREGVTIEQAYTRVLLPALIRMRHLWRKNQISAADVHVATDICRYTIFRVMDSIFGERKYPFRALVACVPEEEDELGSEVFANYLEIKGWTVYHIGHGFSADDILHALAVNQPQVAVLSVVSISWLRAAKQLVGQIRQTAPQVKLVMEGRAVEQARTAFEPLVDKIVTGLEEGHKAMLDMVMPHA
jgi:methanogenic corrinoid protein MtbC1